MTITWISAEWMTGKRVSQYPRIGGGTRLKDFGASGRSVRIVGRARLDQVADLEALETQLEAQRDWAIQVPFTGGFERRIVVRFASSRVAGIGAGNVEIQVEALVVE